MSLPEIVPSPNGHHDPAEKKPSEADLNRYASAQLELERLADLHAQKALLESDIAQIRHILNRLLMQIDDPQIRKRVADQFENMMNP